MVGVRQLYTREDEAVLRYGREYMGAEYVRIRRCGGQRLVFRWCRPLAARGLATANRRLNPEEIALKLSDQRGKMNVVVHSGENMAATPRLAGRPGRGRTHVCAGHRRRWLREP